MSNLPPECQDLGTPVEALLGLLAEEPTLRNRDGQGVRVALKKALAQEFEIVFAGAFSAGKSMLINALLGRELLYSAEGHATGTECRVAYAPSVAAERVVLTFLSEMEIRELAAKLSGDLGWGVLPGIHQPEVNEQVQATCRQIVGEEGGPSRSSRAQKARALQLLLEGFLQNRDRIQTRTNATFAMEQLPFAGLKEAIEYARRGSNSSVLRRIEYFCHDPLLADGNVLVDTPGIDAPVARDAELTYAKIADPDTSAVVCVLKPAAAGEMTPEETRLLEATKGNPSVRDRVFFVFNRIDETWYNPQLRQRWEQLVESEFVDRDRVYATSALLGFYGRLLQNTGPGDRFGLDSVWQEEVHSGTGEETPAFVQQFIRYCIGSQKLPASFRISANSYETPNQNYVRILGQWGQPLLARLVMDSGIETFREAIIRYLTTEKRPSLFADLAADLQPHCLALREHLVTCYREWQGIPQDVAALKQQELAKLSQDLKAIGDELLAFVNQVLNETVASDRNSRYEADFQHLRMQMVQRLDELLAKFSVADCYRRAQASHPRHATVPVMSILTEAFYLLADELEAILGEASVRLVDNFFWELRRRIANQECYRQLGRLLGSDGGTLAAIAQWHEQTRMAVRRAANTECDRYVRERPEFYAEGSLSLWQLRQTLRQACEGYDFKTMVEAEAAIKQILKLDFEQKVKATVFRHYRQTLDQTLNDICLTGAAQQATAIVQQYEAARAHLTGILEQEAIAKIQQTQTQLTKVRQQIERYNAAVQSINRCLSSIGGDRQRLPLIADSDLLGAPTETPPTDPETVSAIATVS
ncbi:MAG: dynamin family protein [Pseudanabaenaceae cyanobacterium]